MDLCTSWRKLHRANEFAANAALTAGTNLALSALGIISGILAARLLGPHGRGELAAIQTWPSFVATLAMLGMPEAIVYYSACSPEQAGRYLGSAVSVGLLCSVPFIAAAYLLMPFLLHAQPPTIVWAGRWYLFIVPIHALVGLLAHPLRGRSHFLPWNLMRPLPNVLWIGVLLLAWKLARATPTFVAGANLVALALLIFPFGGIVAGWVPGPFTPDRRKLPAMLRYGLPCMMTGVPQMLNLRLDQMLMAALLPSRELGLYVVAVAWSGAVAPLLTAIGSVTLPAAASANNLEQGARRVAAAARGTAALATVSCAGLSAVTPFVIVLLFSDHFRDSIPAAMVLVPAAGVLGFGCVLEEGLRGLGRPYAVLKAELAGLAVTALGLATMLRPMGIMGAATASLLGYSATAGALLFFVRRYAGVSARALLLPRNDEIKLVLSGLFSVWRVPGASTDA